MTEIIYDDIKDSDNLYICRICLCTDKLLRDIELYKDKYEFMSGIKISSFDDLPKWICTTCCMYLIRSSLFKKKILSSHDALLGWHTRNVLFPINAKDTDITNYASPNLNRSEILVVDDNFLNTDGFYEVLEHAKLLNNIDTDLPKLEFDLKTELSDDDDDNVPLVEFCSNIDDESSIVNENNEVDLDNNKNTKGRKRKIKDGRKEKKKKLPPKISSSEVDPLKIKVIMLNPIEQMEEQKRVSEECGFNFCCEKCYKGFNYENKLINHMKKHSPSRGSFKCDLCQMYLPTKYSLNVHMIIHTRRYQCLKCNRQMTDKLSMEEHYRNQHEGIVSQYTCHICGKVSSNNKTHRGHMRNQHGNNRPTCSLCNKSFVNLDSLNEHLLIHKGVKNYACLICNKKFRTKTQVKHHQMKHSDVREYYCVECDIRFKSEHNLKQHLTKNLKHLDKHSLKYECKKCPRKFQTEKELNRHIETRHLFLIKYECDICNATLANKSSLARHVRAHGNNETKPRNHVCHLCKRCFTSSYVLANHARTHSGERPFRCQSCGRSFTQKSALVTHYKTQHLRIKRNAKIKLEELGIEMRADSKDGLRGFFKETNCEENWRPNEADFYAEMQP